MSAEACSGSFRRMAEARLRETVYRDRAKVLQTSCKADRGRAKIRDRSGRKQPGSCEDPAGVLKPG